MKNTYSWQIIGVKTKNKKRITNIIHNVHWMLTAKDSSDLHITKTTFGDLDIKYEEGNVFIKYSDLKKSDIVGWLESNPYFDSIKEKLDSQVEEAKKSEEELLRPNWA
tara:strand:+ start:49 stop:372 length:324 start_codon:yes stop_codon:yes gene_type:complete